MSEPVMTVCARGHIRVRGVHCKLCARDYRREKGMISREVIDPEVDTVKRSALPRNNWVRPGFWENLVRSVALLSPDQMKLVRFPANKVYSWNPSPIRSAARKAGLKIGVMMFGHKLYVWKTGTTRKREQAN